MPILLGVGAVDLGHEVTDEGLLVERREIGAQEVVASAEETVMVDLEKDTRGDIRIIATRPAITDENERVVNRDNGGH